MLFRSIYIFSFPFSLFVSVYVCVSFCDFVCIPLLQPFVLGFCLSVSYFLFFLVQSLALIITGGFVFWFGCSLLSFFLFFYYFSIFLFLIIIFYFNNFILFFAFFLSSFSSEVCGSQGLGALAGCQDCASEVGDSR